MFASLRPVASLLRAAPRLSAAHLRLNPPVLCAVNPLSSRRRCLATTTDVRDTQNLIEKIVQRYAVDLPEGYKVRSGDYVTIQPEHIMTHDNTGAVIPKWVFFWVFPFV